jgi:hypothetical protein
MFPISRDIDSVFDCIIGDFLLLDRYRDFIIGDFDGEILILDQSLLGLLFMKSFFLVVLVGGDLNRLLSSCRF